MAGDDDRPQPDRPQPSADPTARAITVVAAVGLAITVIVAVAISVDEATDPTRSASIPWAGVVALVAAVGGIALLIASRRR